MLFSSSGGGAKPCWKVRWILTTVALGYPSINEFWESGRSFLSQIRQTLKIVVEYEKIRHIYAQTDVGQLPPKIASRPGGSIESVTGTKKDR